MFGLPFFNKYPYTNLEQLNLDWLMEKVGQFDARITAVEERATSLEERMTTAEGDIDALEERMTTAEGDIDSLEERMTTAEGDIDAVEERMTTAEGDIDAVEERATSLEERMTTAEGDINAVEGDIINIEGMIANHYDESSSYGVGDFVIYNDVLYKCISSTSGTFDPSKWEVVNVTSGLVALNTEVDTLETAVSDIPVVIANPGGSGATLSTLKVNDTVYEIPSSGGGGGADVSIIGFDDDHLTADSWFIDPTDVSKIPDLYDLTKIVYVHDLYTNEYYSRSSVMDDGTDYIIEFNSYDTVHHVGATEPEYREEIMESIKLTVNKTTGVLSFTHMAIRDETLHNIDSLYYTFTVNNLNFDSTTTFTDSYTDESLSLMKIFTDTPVTILCSTTTPGDPYYIFRDDGATWVVNNVYRRMFRCSSYENGSVITKHILCQFDETTTPETFAIRGLS